MRLIAVALASMALAACASTVPQPQPGPQPAPPITRPPVVTRVPPTAPPPPPVAGFRTPEIMRGPGLDGVVRERAPSLVRQFGQPRLDVAEGDMRKLQFASEACVLDVYLYPLRPGAEPESTWLEARRSSDGAEVDLLACMQALRRAGN
ncbi:hypothetical protein M3P36_02940 [Altererythrobacter sp. KTW20L]|uniref:hypothetical protein n=1 Tax=Altererythrobacter sp. KTW20L TaxID=2942210 RepID=UPI0020BD9105|nr:hypothetical protein [Altererythrobacter sp. KTW20L]MCL6250008.1 hypothetical protein [Altererythrobacter sp. KTW20L]